MNLPMGTSATEAEVCLRQARYDDLGNRMALEIMAAALIVTAILYLAALAALYFAEPKLLYFPNGAETRPPPLACLRPNGAI